jgi:hypothetical protein
MKVSDIGGFAAILYAGYLIGERQADTANPWTNKDYIEIGALLLIGFYLAVVLS